MKIAGIVAEYNPFHNGHQYHIEETKKQTGADYIIAVMSGDFVQRGAPAFLDKYERARAALLGGCDLVLELPVIYSTASAEFFASGAVRLLDGLGICAFLSFGSEEGNLKPLYQLAELLTEEPEEYKRILKLHLKSGLSFPAAREQALEEYFLTNLKEMRNISIPSFLKGSNNILALEYLKTLKKSQKEALIQSPLLLSTFLPQLDPKEYLHHPKARLGLFTGELTLSDLP
jgi:predicted nucleotidyltransferase